MLKYISNYLLLFSAIPYNYTFVIISAETHLSGKLSTHQLNWFSRVLGSNILSRILETFCPTLLHKCMFCFYDSIYSLFGETNNSGRETAEPSASERMKKLYQCSLSFTLIGCFLSNTAITF